MRINYDDYDDDFDTFEKFSGPKPKMGTSRKVRKSSQESIEKERRKRKVEKEQLLTDSENVDYGKQDAEDDYSRYTAF